MQNRAGASNQTARALTMLVALLAGSFVNVLDAGEIPDTEIYTTIRNNDLARLRSILRVEWTPTSKTDEGRRR
jgi:hypothetical protein